jgi:site-specific DNA-methyltransferase (adenine-specific)
METNALYYGDNLVWLRRHDFFPSEFVDLIYLDPPFNSNADYNVIFSEPSGAESQAQLQAFDDTWKWNSEASAIAQNELAQRSPELSDFISWLGRKRGKTYQSMAAYLGMMAVRLIELHRALKATGSIYLHCDSTASHYLKMVMDSIFGIDNFRNEIVWKRQTAHKGTERYGKIHDILLCYSKSKKVKWHPQFTSFSQGYIDRFYCHIDEDGRRYTLSDLMAAGVRHGSSGMLWHGIDPTTRGRHWQFTIEDLDKLDKEGRIYHSPKGGVPRYKRYLDEMKGVAPQDIWLDIPPVQAHSKEKLGYQTQKPESLLERIISQSSDEGDIVLDPFCGCGTALIVANKLKRRWIGVDITHLAIFLIEQRLKDSFGELIKDTYKVYGDPEDIESAKDLWRRDPKEFELWALSLVGARPRARDGGVDGVMGFVDEGRQTKRIIVQVKGGENLNPTIIRDLIGTVDNEKAAIGLLITLHKPTSGMVQAAVHADYYNSPLWNKSFPRIQIRTIEELLIEGKRFDLPPQVTTLKKAERIKEQGYIEPLL